MDGIGWYANYETILQEHYTMAKAYCFFSRYQLTYLKKKYTKYGTAIVVKHI